MPDLLCMGEPMLELNAQPPLPDGRVLYLQGHGGDTSNAAVCAARQGAGVGYVTGGDRAHAAASSPHAIERFELGAPDRKPLVIEAPEGWTYRVVDGTRGAWLIVRGTGLEGVGSPDEGTAL